MNKLLELKELEATVSELLRSVSTEGICICYHSQYELPTLSLFTKANSTNHVLALNGIVYLIEESITEEAYMSVIQDIERILNENRIR